MSDEKIIYKIPAKSIKFLDEVHDSAEINFVVDDYCRIKSAYYRSPYKRSKYFRIESIKNNYVTVDPDTKHILISDPLNGFDITNNKKFKIILRGWKQKIPFSELEIIKYMTFGQINGSDLNDSLKLCYNLGY